MDFQFIVATENGFRRRTEVEIEPVFSINKNAKDISVDDIVNKDIISVEIKNENKVLDIIANAGIKDIEVVKEMILNLKKNGNYEIALSEGVDVYVSPWEPQQMEDLIPTPRAASNDFVLDEMFEFLTASCSHLVYEQTIILKSTKLILNIISNILTRGVYETKFYAKMSRFFNEKIKDVIDDKIKANEVSEHELKELYLLSLDIERLEGINKDDRFEIAYEVIQAFRENKDVIS